MIPQCPECGSMMLSENWTQCGICSHVRKREAEDRLARMACSAGWLPIDAAPKDGTEIIVYCPPAHGLNHMASVCAYHEDAGFCVDELREPTLWIPLPNEPSPSVDTN